MPVSMLSIGAIIIGNEVLSGRRRDQHFDFLRRFTQSRQLRLSYVYYIPDVPADIEATLTRCFTQAIPCFCFGGIGNTPDDHTRASAARAIGKTLQHHPEAFAELAIRFPDISRMPERARFAYLPETATMVINPINRIPGFRIRNITFLPGFPEMAHPMLVQEMDSHYFRHYHPDNTQRLVHITGAHESDLLSFMEMLESSYDITISSLPSMQRPPLIEFGIHGTATAVEAAYQRLMTTLTDAGYGVTPIT